jgi:polyferredoxin
MLRKARIILSVVIFGLITFYFLDFAEILPNSFHRLAHIQFVPALMSLSFIILVVLVLITLLLGRIYCSTICPMGIFQDIVTWISKKRQRKRNVSAIRLPRICCVGEYWV